MREHHSTVTPDEQRGSIGNVVILVDMKTSSGIEKLFFAVLLGENVQVKSS